MWTFAVGPRTGSLPTRQIPKARSRRVTFRVDGPREAQFSIDGRSDEAAAIVPLETDLWCWRDSTLMFRGRIAPWQGTGTEKVHTDVYTALDYRWLLGRRKVVNASGVDGATFAATSQATIAWNLINWAQTVSGGSMGITDGVGNTSATNRDRTIEPGAWVGEQIAMIGRLQNGFEWEIDPLRAFNRWYPQRGADTGVVLDYGGAVTAWRGLTDPATFGNDILVTGAQGLTPVTAVSTGIATDPKGRWGLVESFPSIIEQGTLNARGPQLLAEAEVIRYDWAVTLRQGYWQGFGSGPGKFGHGDTIVWALKSGRFDFATDHRVMEMQVAIGESGEEVVTCGLVAA